MTADLHQLASAQADKARALFASTAALLDLEGAILEAIRTTAATDPDLAAWLRTLLPAVQLHRCLTDGAYTQASRSAEELAASAQEAA